MKLERRGQRVAPFPKFLNRLFRYGLLAAALITISLCIGTAGYHALGGLGWVDSFHMSCMILTGMGPVAEMQTVSAKIFSSCYALYSGIAFLSISAVFLSPILHRLLHILQVSPEEEEENKG